MHVNGQLRSGYVAQKRTLTSTLIAGTEFLAACTVVPCVSIFEQDSHLRSRGDRIPRSLYGWRHACRYLSTAVICWTPTLGSRSTLYRTTSLSRVRATRARNRIA